MKTHAKSIGIKSPLRIPGSHPQETERPEGTLLTTGPLGSGNLQALASELNQSATQGVFQYPRIWQLTSKVAAVLLIAIAAMRVIQVVRPVLDAAQAHLPIESAGVSAWQLVGVAFGAVFAILAGALLTNLFPTIRVVPQGLGISELLGWRRVRWDQVDVLRVMELANDRYVVMIPFKGSSRPPTPAPVLRLIPWLAGASSGGRGLIITSEIQNFDRMLQLMVSYMAEAAGQSLPRLELFVDETAVMPLAQLVLQPEDAVVRMARRRVTLDAFGLAADDVEPVLDWKKILPRQMLIALPAPLLLLSASIRLGGSTPSWGHLAWAVILFALGVAELPFMAKLVQMVGDMMVGSGQLARSAMAYLELQMPRVLLISLGLVFVTVGLPPVVAEVAWFVGIGLTLWLTVRFVQRVYYISVVQTLLAAVGSIVFQVALLALFFSVS